MNSSLRTNMNCGVITVIIGLTTKTLPNNVNAPKRKPREAPALVCFYRSLANVTIAEKKEGNVIYNIPLNYQHVSTCI